MKSFIMSLIVFIVTAALVITNSIYISNTVEKLLDRLESLPNNETEYNNGTKSLTEKYDDLYEAWGSSKPIIGLSVNAKKLDYIEERLTDLKARIGGDSFADFKSTRQVIRMLFNDLKQKEILSFDNIF